MGKINILIKAIALIILMALFLGCQKTYFEGVISYEMEYIDESGEMSEEETKQYMGNEQTYFFKRDKYKSIMNGLLKLTLFYTGKDKLYSTIEGNNELMYIDTKHRDEKVLSFEIKKNQSTILGYNCDVLEVKTSDGTMLYYFNKSFKINKDLYKNHEKGFWYFCLDKTNGALPIKWVTKTSGLKLTIVANKIDTTELDDSIFELPKGLSLTKSED